MKNNWLSKKEYNFIYSRVPRLCVDLVIKDSRGVLLTWRKIEPAKNTWHVPGGRVFLGETLRKAATRIAKSELGIKIKPVRLLGFMEFPWEKQDGKLRHTVSAVFLAKPVTNNFRLDSQAGKLKFFKKNPGKVYSRHLQFLLEQNLF